MWTPRHLLGVLIAVALAMQLEEAYGQSKGYQGRKLANIGLSLASCIATDDATPRLAEESGRLEQTLGGRQPLRPFGRSRSSSSRLAVFLMVVRSIVVMTCMHCTSISCLHCRCCKAHPLATIPASFASSTTPLSTQHCKGHATSSRTTSPPTH
jgi:hypothetical protein